MRRRGICPTQQRPDAQRRDQPRFPFQIPAAFPMASVRRGGGSTRGKYARFSMQKRRPNGRRLRFIYQSREITSQVSVLSATVTLMTQLPEPTSVTRPVSSTTATDSLELDHSGVSSLLMG